MGSGEIASSGSGLKRFVVRTVAGTASCRKSRCGLCLCFRCGARALYVAFTPRGWGACSGKWAVEVEWTLCACNRRLN